MQQNTKYESIIPVIREYVRTMPMSSIWVQIVAITHGGAIMDDPDDAVDLIMNELAKHPEALSELANGIAYVCTNHADDIRAQTEAVLNSISIGE
jgi:GTPase involved in cell partitioning and DNA repair